MHYKMRLRIIQDVDGRKGPVTQWSEFLAKNRGLVDTFRGVDAVLFYNQTRTWFRFSSGFDRFTSEEKPGFPHDFNALIHVQFTLEKGEWNPARLVDFAHARGIELIGLKDFSTYYSEWAEKKREARRTNK